MKSNENQNEIIKHSFNELMIMAKVFAESGMFADTKQAAQAFVKIQAGNEIGIPPFQSMSGINIILGKTTLGAGVIASRVKGSGKYDYKVIELSEKNCSIDFFQGKEKIGSSSFSLDDAKKAGTKNLEKFPRNMLFARAISNGVKWFCPDVFSGPVYVPEEMPEQERKIEEAEAKVIEPDPIQSSIYDEYLKIIEETDLLTSDQKDLFTKDYLTWPFQKMEKAIVKLKLTLAEIEQSIEAQK